MNKGLLMVLFVFGAIKGSAQVSNSDPQKGAINITLPKTPESQGFDKYGNIQVSELTGTPDISVPIYTVNSKFLSVPITLTYDPSGIKVSQEASWVGLGFNLIAGGRITVETKGAVDEDPVAQGLSAPTYVKYGMQKLFHRLGDSSNLSILTFASTCYYCDTSINNIPDNAMSMWALSQYGLGEPDIYRANFMGHSLTFYFDKITDELKWLGEKSFFNISFVKDGYNRIQTWTITDNMGNRYYFNQKENTTLTLPPYGTLYNNSSTTAWLMTKILHPTGDSIVLSYTNYGNSYPATNWNASVSVMLNAGYTLSNDNEQSKVIQQPAYLTKIESNDVSVNFILGNRTDLKGSGSKALTRIEIRDKQTNTVRKKASFNYSYFTGSLESCYNTLADSVKNFYRQRLKLNTLTINDSSSLQPPYQFFYYGGSEPHKYSFGQDHWGYYNGAGNGYTDPCSPKGLIPSTGLNFTYSMYPALSLFNAIRDCSPLYMPMMTMDSIVYPTGGSTKFIYEPHQTSQLIGGGLRIKTIRNHGSSSLANNIEYSYASGVYMGTIVYRTMSYGLSKCNTVEDIYAPQTKDNASANGAINNADFLIGYSSVTKTQKDDNGQINGYVVKLFNVPDPKVSSFMGLGFNVLPAHWPTIPPNHNIIDYLYPAESGYAPTPIMQLDGKLFQEKYYDKSSSLLKSVNYYYTQADYSQRFYSLRVTDNQIAGGTCGEEFGTEAMEEGQRRFTAFVSPAKSFYTLTDSVVEKTYQGSNFITQKKAYKYNSHYQPEYESIYNSDGTQTINYTKTSAEMEAPYYPFPPSGDAVLMNDLKGGHIYDLPVEQAVIKRTVAGDSLVIQSRLNIYQAGLAKKVYILEAATPPTYRSQFIPLYYTYPNYPGYPSGNYTLKMDDRYKLYSSADYSVAGQIKGLHSLQGNSAYIWDQYYNQLLAQCVNADSADVAFTSFETPEKGRWTFNAAGIGADNTAPTGNKRYLLTSGNITIAGLNPSKAYRVSYWSKSTAQNVNGTTATAGIAINGWTYYEHLVNNPAGGNIALSGSGTIDELRLYPKNSLMTTYTYEPITGITSQCDANNRISYFEYDVIGRLARMRDEKRNITKQFEYKFTDIFQFPYGNTEQVQTFTKNDCGAGYTGTEFTYTVPANKYGSFINVQDANRKAQAEIARSITQASINETGSCFPYYTFSSCCGWGAAFSHFSVTGTGSVEFSLVLSGNGVAYGQIGTLTGPFFLPSVIRYVNLTSQGHGYTLVFYPSGQINIMGSNYTGMLQLSGSFAL